MELTKEWFIEIWEDLYHAGIDNEGRPYHASSYCIVLEHISGKRLIHDRIYHGCERQVTINREDGEEYVHFYDLSKEAIKEVNKLKNAIMARRHIHLQYWKEMEPVYGSDHYCKRNNF